jgi:hypothetical protein
LNGEEAAVPVGELRWREEGGDVFGAVVGEEPSLDKGVYVVELRHFDEKGRHGGGATGNEFQVTDGREKSGATALGILPSLPVLKSESGKEASEAIEFSARRARRGDGADKRDSLNHRFDCIVWSTERDCCCHLLHCAAKGRFL